jgi:hypothetical protein
LPAGIIIIKYKISAAAIKAATRMASMVEQITLLEIFLACIKKNRLASSSETGA